MRHTSAGGQPAPTSKLTVIDRPVATLRPDPRNPRQHSKLQVRQIARSIEAFGFNVPILVDGAGQVIAGHGRLLASKHLGWQDVPTISLEHLSPTQLRAFMIADNRLTDTSSWDDLLLGETLRELSTVDLTFSIEATGFSMPEIDLRIVSLDLETTPGKPDKADRVQPAGPSVSRPGDLWLLDHHRVLCGSALESDSYLRLLQGNQAQVVFTDPPYNVPVQGHVSGLGGIQHREFAMASGEMSETEFTGFLARVCHLMAQHSTDGSLHFICMDWRHMAELQAAATAAYAEMKNLCVWAKDNAGMGSLYRSQHELVFVYKKGNAPHRNNVELGRHGRHRSNVWRYAGVNSFARTSDEGNLLALHPTVKPVKLVADALLDCSARSDIVLDPFLGSGTTLMAAQRTGRQCRGLEIDPLYVDTIIRRWQAFTGDQARHADTGQSFDSMEAMPAEPSQGAGAAAAVEGENTHGA